MTKEQTELDNDLDLFKLHSCLMLAADIAEKLEHKGVHPKYLGPIKTRCRNFNNFIERHTEPVMKSFANSKQDVVLITYQNKLNNIQEIIINHTPSEIMGGRVELESKSV